MEGVQALAMISRPALTLAAGCLVLAAAIPKAGLASVEPGIVVERHRAPRAPEVDIGDRMITLVRVDLRRYAFRFLTEARHGARRTLPEWMRDEALAGGINAGMFLASGRPCGFLQSGGEVWNDRRPRSFEGVIAFDPRRRAAPFAIGGRGCPADLDAMRSSHASLLQANRVMIDCAGRPNTAWRTRRYSSAALGVDDQGRAVLIHVRTPYRMQRLARMLVDLDLGLRGLVYMEGGPEASLMVRAEGERVGLMGSYEDGFYPSDDNRAYWDLPNVVGFAER